jgi:phenylpropionate dioxygenase-like ring-hydroxylating dioxygenase large terminal subunit
MTTIADCTAATLIDTRLSMPPRYCAFAAVQDGAATRTAVTVVAQVFALQPSAILTETRGRAGVALARQIAMYLAHVVCGQTLTDVGAQFSRDRTTVAHACRLVEARRDDPSFDRIVELLEWILPSLASRAPRCGPPPRV